MKKVYKSSLVFLFFAVIFSSCREGIVEPVRLLQLYVVDTLGVPISNAKVDFYFSETALNNNGAQILESFYTNEEGFIELALDIDIFDYYVNIEKGQLNNWYTNTFVNLPNLQQKNVMTIPIKDSFKAKLTGKYKKRWQQTEDIINGNPAFPNCANQLYHDFIRRVETVKNNRDGEVAKFQTSFCPFPGTSEGINQWIYDEQNHTITFGIGIFAEIYKITEFTEDKMTLFFATPDGAFVKEKKYKLIN